MKFVIESGSKMSPTEENLGDWKLWCRLCAKKNSQNNVNVFLKDDHTARWTGSHKSSSELSLPAAIGKYFWVNITRDDDLPKTICCECFSLIRALQDFADRAVKVQKLFCMLQQNASVDSEAYLSEIRLKCGLIDGEREHLVPLQLPECRQIHSEVYYLDEKPDVSDFSDNINDELILENPLEPKGALEIKSEEHIDSKDCNINQDSEPDTQEGERLTPVNEPGRISNTKCDKKHKYSLHYECEECPRKFRRIDHFQQHMKYTHKHEISIGPVQCPVCEKQFETKIKMERHKKAHLPVEKRIPCAYCEKLFRNNGLLQSHIRCIHKDERQFICEECGAAARTNQSLKSHMLVHTTDAPFECEVCKKCFKDGYRLRKHKEIHDPNKHICPECGLQLNSRVTLNRHLLVHSDQMQHKCDYCGRQFKRGKALKNHLILHTGLKPYSCDFCDRTFANGSNCRTHKKKAHPVELAAQEAGGTRSYTHNIPKLDALKAITKNKDNLSPVVSKQSGNFAFGKKSKSLNPLMEEI